MATYRNKCLFLFYEITKIFNYESCQEFFDGCSGLYCDGL